MLVLRMLFGAPDKSEVLIIAHCIRHACTVKQSLISLPLSLALKRCRFVAIHSTVDKEHHHLDVSDTLYLPRSVMFCPRMDFLSKIQASAWSILSGYRMA